MIQARKNNRLQSYDYSTPGYYFVTICVKDRICCLGEIKEGRMVLNEYGLIVQSQWQWLEKNFTYVKLDEYIVMPNHFHGILIMEPVGNGLDRSLHRRLPLSNIVGAFKTTSSKIIHQSEFTDFSWQKSFYDHVIRQDESLGNIRQYIQNNPKQWELDEYNPKILKSLS